VVTLRVTIDTTKNILPTMASVKYDRESAFLTRASRQRGIVLNRCAASFGI
jgi:hypothetical protein